MLFVKNENAYEEQSSVLDIFKDSENIVSPALLKSFKCMEKKEKK